MYACVKLEPNNYLHVTVILKGPVPFTKAPHADQTEYHLMTDQSHPEQCTHSN